MVARVVELTKMREEALLAKRKFDIISRARDAAENKGRNIQQLIDGKSLKRTFEAQYSQPSTLGIPL